MSSDRTFPTYLLPSLPFPFSFRRRPQSTSSSSSDSFDVTIPSLSSSPTSPVPVAASSRPPAPSFLAPLPTASHGLTSRLHTALQRDRGPQTHEQGHLYRGHPNTLKCITCGTDIASISQIVSKGFTGRYGRAVLVAPLTPLASENKEKNGRSMDLVNIRMGRAVDRELLTGAHVVADVSCIICYTLLGWKYVDASEEGQRYKIGKFILETKRVAGTASWEDSAMPDEIDPAGDADNDNDDVVIFDEDDEDECEDLFMGVWDPHAVAKRRARRVNTRKSN